MLKSGCQRTTAGDVDVSRIRIDNQYWLMYGFGYIFHEPDVAVNIDGGITSESHLEVGDYVCLSGWHSNYTGYYSGYSAHVNSDPCGHITTVKSAQHENMPVVGSATSCPGDSGGGWVFYPGGRTASGGPMRFAYGINRNGTEPAHADDGPCSSGAEVWFTSLSAAYKAFDAASPGSNIRVITR